MPQTIGSLISSFPELSHGRKITGAELEQLHNAGSSSAPTSTYTVVVKTDGAPEYPAGSGRRLFLGGDARGQADYHHAKARFAHLASRYNGAEEAHEVARARDEEFHFKRRNAVPPRYSQKGRIYWSLFNEGLTDSFDPFSPTEVAAVFHDLGRKNAVGVQDMREESVFAVSYKHFLDKKNKMAVQVWQDIIAILQTLVRKGGNVRLWVDSKAPSLEQLPDAVGWVAKGIYPYTVLPVITPRNHYGKYGSRLWINAEHQLAVQGEGLYTLDGDKIRVFIQIQGRGDYGTRELACKILNGEFIGCEGQSITDDKLLIIWAMHELKAGFLYASKMRYVIAREARVTPTWITIETAECIFNEWRCRRKLADATLGKSNPCWDVVARTFPGVFKAWGGFGFPVRDDEKSPQWICKDRRGRCFVVNPRCVALAGKYVTVMGVSVTPDSTPISGHVLETVLTRMPTEEAMKMILLAPEWRCKWRGLRDSKVDT